MRKIPPFESQLSRLSLIASVPFLILTVSTMLYASISLYLVALTLFVGGLVVAYANVRIHQKAAYQFRSLTNLLEAMTQGDYSMRARSQRNSGALNELIDSINGLALRLSHQKQVSIESQLLLKTVIEHIDVAIIALSPDGQIIFINPAMKRLVKDQALIDATQISELVPDTEYLQSGETKVVEVNNNYFKGKFKFHLETFRQSGEEHKLLFITDVRALLRQEERNAWQSLVRVISHEINNSLAPIASISQTLQKLVKQEVALEEEESISDGLAIIEQRAKGLTEFIDSYRKLAKLPEPKITQLSLTELFKKQSLLFEKINLQLLPKEDIAIKADPIQLEQVMINLLKNALESQEQAKIDSPIAIDWQELDDKTVIKVIDQGVGIQNEKNLFVPFYTTKKQGTGIGLLFCRQVIEAHNGSLSLTSRQPEKGVIATIELPRF